MRDTDHNSDRPLRIGSLFSGYAGDLDLAVEQVFGAETVWFSKVNEHVVNIFADHWPGVPNLGDITAIDWDQVEPVDIVCGGFPCQDYAEGSVIPRWVPRCLFRPGPGSLWFGITVLLS